MLHERNDFAIRVICNQNTSKIYTRKQSIADRVMLTLSALVPQESA